MQKARDTKTGHYVIVLSDDVAMCTDGTYWTDAVIFVDPISLKPLQVMEYNAFHSRYRIFSVNGEIK